MNTNLTETQITIFKRDPIVGYKNSTLFPIHGSGEHRSAQSMENKGYGNIVSKQPFDNMFFRLASNLKFNHVHLNLVKKENTVQTFIVRARLRGWGFDTKKVQAETKEQALEIYSAPLLKKYSDPSMIEHSFVYTQDEYDESQRKSFEASAAIDEDTE